MTQGRPGGTDLAQASQPRFPARPSASPSRSSTTSPKPSPARRRTSPSSSAAPISTPARAWPVRRSACLQQFRALPTRPSSRKPTRRSCVSPSTGRRVARYGINVRDVEDVIEMAIGGRPVSTMFEGEQRFDITVRFPEQARTDTTRDRQHPGAHPRWRPHAAFTTGAHRGGEWRQHHRAPREPAPDYRAHQHSRPRPGQLRHRGPGQRSTAKSNSRRLSRRLGRPVREPRARAQTAGDHSAGDHRHHLRPAVLRVRLGGATPDWC